MPRRPPDNLLQQTAERGWQRTLRRLRGRQLTPRTRVDLQVRALLREPLRAYTDAGKPAQGAGNGADRGTRWIPTQHVAVRQLYIPGLYLQGQDKPMYENVFA